MPDCVSMVWDGVAFTCQPLTPHEWAFPVGEGQYPPEMWYSAQQHSATHTGIDLNLDISPRGDIERYYGLSVYSITDGYVSYITDNWSDVPMLVVHTTHLGKPLYIRYAHIVPVVMLGETVKAGQKLGSFANWRSGDHLHLDMATNYFEREWLDWGIHWVDPVDVLKEHLDPARVDAMIARD